MQQSERMMHVPLSHCRRHELTASTQMSTVAICMAGLLVALAGQPALSNQLLSSRFNSHLYPSGSSLLSTAAASMPAASSSALSAPAFKDLSGPTSGKIQTLDVICGKNFMTVRAEFSGPFYGIVFSKGTYGQENCIYVKPNSGLTHAAFNVYYDQCGTKPDLQGKFYENTIVIQYGSDIIEAYDEAKRLRCEWFEAYEKPATFKPAIPVADLEVVEMNFQGDDIDCWMEIQEGEGPTSREVSKIVSVGQPMTIVVAINDYNGQFDMRVKSCVAHDGVQAPIALTDEYGCVLRPKMLTAFQKVRNPGGIHKKATILSYSRFLAFKFPDSMTVQIQCTVEVCRHGCADACQRIPSIAATTMQPELSLTAKWPAASNQAALESAPIGSVLTPRQPLEQAGPAQQPPHVAPFNQALPTQLGAMAERFNYQPSRLVPAHQQARPESGASSDELSGSESSQQPAAVVPELRQPSSRQPAQQRRSQDHYDGRIPQYMGPNGSRRPPQVPLHGARLPASSTTAAPTTIVSTTTSSTTSTTTTTTTGAPILSESNSDGAEESNRAGGHIGSPQTDEILQPEAPSSGPVDQEASPRADNAPASMSAEQPVEASKSDEQTPAVGEQTQPASPSEADNKAEASAMKPSLIEAPVASQEQPSGESSQSQAGEQAKPSVQAGDEGEQAKKSDGADQAQREQSALSEQSQPQTQSQSQSQSQSPSSELKTVEVEIPANEEPERQNNGFNSIRLSAGSAELQNQGPASYDSVMFENSRYQDQRGQAQSDQVVQPRAPASASGERRDKGDESSFEVAASQQMGSGKMRFGARSPQPQQSAAALPQPMVSMAENHQPQDNLEMNKESALVNPDRILIDRSDDSASITELDSAASVDEQTRKAEHSSSAGAPDMMASEESSLASSISAKVRPVVGTDELATGPIQIEDRIGAPAQVHESLEEALSRLQRQIPQTAALVSSQGSQQPEQQQQQAQPAAAAPSSGVAEDRSDSNVNRQRAAQQDFQRQKQVDNQPHPNVAGQAKVMPDPSSGLGSRGSLLTQASSVEGVVVPANGPITGQQMAPNSGMISSNQQAIQIQQQQHQQQQQQQPFNKPQIMDVPPMARPVAQITNVPIDLGFASNQLPAMQQLSQHLAQQFQQQQQQQQRQQQQQQQQASSTTAKPSRSRFNLLSPQAALHAVASRFLPKSAQANQQQQQNTRLPTINQQIIPQLLNNVPQLTPEQQQQLFMQQSMYLKQQLGGQLAPANQPASQSKASGLFNRLTSSLHSATSVNQPAAPLTRTRRSLSAGNKGEVGVQKSFMVVTGMDLAFAPSSLNETELPQILEGRRISEEVIYGVCMPIVSLTFVLTCAFWLIVFLLSFCLYLLFKSRRQRQAFSASKLNNAEM